MHALEKWFVTEVPHRMLHKTQQKLTSPKRKHLVELVTITGQQRIRFQRNRKTKIVNPSLVKLLKDSATCK